MAVMSQADDVRASLLASHDRDAVVRRKVAEKVRLVTVEGAERVGLAAIDVADAYSRGKTPDPEPLKAALDEAATAAAAVVLTSDLRAPVELPAMATDGYELRGDHGAPVRDIDAAREMAERDEDGYYPTRIDTTAELAAAHESASEWIAENQGRDWPRFAERYYRLYVDEAQAHMHRIGEAQGYMKQRDEARAKLARLSSVERLLTASLDSKTPRQSAEAVADALSIVRSLLGGE